MVIAHPGLGSVDGKLIWSGLIDQKWKYA